MKKIINIFVAALLFTGVSCTEDMDYKPGFVTSVNTLLVPADNYYVELQSVSTASQKFQWEPASAEDGQLPHYEVVFFAKPDGDIVYRYDAGSKTTVNIGHKEINRAANAAGVEVGADGVIYWSVVASRGLYQARVDATPRRLELTRLLGFNVIPTTLYITGEGSEVGEELSNASKARMTGDGEFTIYQRLEAGKGFKFVSAKEGDYTSYTVVNGVLDDQSTVPATVATTGVYRITLDMNVRGISFTLVNKVVYNFAPRTSDNREMTYIGNGCWKMTDYKVQFREEGWGLDERYNFHPFFDGVEYVWAADGDSRPGGMTGDEYKITKELPFTGDAYGPVKYKFHGDLNGKTVDITVKMSGDIDAYTHVIDNIR